MPNSSLKFVTPSDPVLSKIATEIPVDEINSDLIQDDIEKMLKVAYGEQSSRKKPVLVGLAAPQVGISKRIILVDLGADGHGGVANLQVFINPQITYFSEETNEWYEGCFSTDRVCGIVTRPHLIKVSALTREGTPIDGRFEGYVARIFQHEIDHLNGKEFTTHISDPDKLHWVEEDEFPSYRDREAWRNWKNKCTFEKWKEIKAGMQ